MYHLNCFHEASGLGSNWDKTIGMCLGYWADNILPEFDSTDFNWVNHDESIRVLGILVGKNHHLAIAGIHLSVK